MKKLHVDHARLSQLTVRQSQKTTERSKLNRTLASIFSFVTIDHTDELVAYSKQ